MNFHTNILVGTDSVFFKSDPLNGLNTEKIVSNTTKTLKLSFDKELFLNLYVTISGFSKEEHLGNSFTINRPINKSDSFFQKLYNLLEEKENITLLKIKSVNDTVFWAKGSFIINSNDLITITIKNELIVNNNETRLNKLLNTLSVLESKLDKPDISKKYLTGYLEERGATSFNDFINYHL